MTIRKTSVSLLCAAVALVGAPLLSLADTTTNAPTAPAVSAATDTAPAPVATPADTNAPAVTPTMPPAPADQTATGERPTTYTMVKGDTLDSVAKKFDTSIHALVTLNRIPKSMYKKLRPGKVLQIPPANSSATPPPAAK